MVTQSTIGAGLALGTAVFWGISPLCFASAGRQIGSYPVALLRVALATGLLLTILPLYKLAAGASLSMPISSQWFWLLVSGVIGMGFGDLLGYEALATLGPRRTTQLITIAPVASVLLAWVWLGETFQPLTLAGMVVVLSATSYAVLVRSSQAQVGQEPGHVSGWGLFCAIGGAVLMGVGAVTARQAFRLGEIDPLLRIDPILATTIRVGGAAVFLWLIAAARREVVRLWRHMADPLARDRILLGTLLGPTLGMICYVSALKYTKTGVVSTLSSISPLVLLPIVYLRYKAKIGWDVVVACVLAIAGVAIIQWRG
jgi:drug/metabolite transporter (DMT)-like permease